MRRQRDSQLRIVLSQVYSWPEVRRGGERYLHEVASALADAGHRVCVISSAPNPGRARILDVPVTYLRRKRLAPGRFGPGSDELAFGLEAAARLAVRGLDVWHALGAADALGATILGKTRRVRSVHTTLGTAERWYWDSRRDRRVHDFVVRHVDAYICLSQAAGRSLQQGWGRKPIVLGGGVDLRRFKPASGRHDRPALLYSGDLAEPRKNIRLLLEATAVLRKRRPDVELWLSGPGQSSNLLTSAPAGARDAIVDLGVGREEDQSDRYGRAWVTVLPSEHEAFGLCLVESLACGTPIVALRSGGGPPEIVRDGVGVLSGARAEELADACDAALELAAAPDTVDACRAEAAHYDWRQSIIPRLEDIYRG